MKLNKYEKKLKGGILNIDINNLIDCIIIKKSCIIAFYYYYYNKQINIDTIDSFLEDLFEKTIKMYIEKYLFKSFCECMIKLLNKKYERFKYNSTNLTTIKYNFLGELIYTLNNEYNNINFDNYGSEGYTLYCVDNPEQFLKHICYFINIMSNYLNYYSRLNDSIKQTDKLKIYKIEDIFKKIGYDIAIYIFIFISIDYDSNFKGFSDNTKKRIISIFKKHFIREFKSLFNNLNKGNIILSYLSYVKQYKKYDETKFNELEDTYINYKQRKLSPQDDYLFEQKLYNLYKYKTLNLSHCNNDKIKFLSFINNVYINPNNQGINSHNNEEKPIIKIEEIKGKQLSKIEEEQLSKIEEEIEEEKQLSEKELSDMKKENLSEIEKELSEIEKGKQLSEIKEQLPEIKKEKQQSKIEKITKMIIDNRISLTTHDYEDTYKLAMSIYNRQNIIDKELFSINLYWFLKQNDYYFNIYQSQFRTILAKNTYSFTDKFKDLFIDDKTLLDEINIFFKIILYQKIKKISIEDLKNFFIIHEKIKNKILNLLKKTTLHYIELLKILSFLYIYIFFYNLLQDDILNILKQLKQLRLTQRINIKRILIKKSIIIDNLYMFVFNKLILLGNIENSKLVAELVNTTFQKKIILPEKIKSVKDQKLTEIIKSSSSESIGLSKPVKSLITTPKQLSILKDTKLNTDIILPTSLKPSSHLVISNQNMKKILDVAKKIFSHFEIMESNIIQLYIPKKKCEDPLIKYFMSQNIKLFVSKECINLILQMLSKNEKNKKLIEYFGKLKLGYSSQIASYKTKTEQLLLLEKQEISKNFIDIVNEGIKTKNLSEILKANGSILNMFGTFLHTTQPKIKSLKPELQEDIIKIFKFERYLILNLYKSLLDENSIKHGNKILKQKETLILLNKIFLANSSLIKEKPAIKEPAIKEPAILNILTPQQLFELRSPLQNTIITDNEQALNIIENLKEQQKLLKLVNYDEKILSNQYSLTNPISRIMPRQIPIEKLRQMSRIMPRQMSIEKSRQILRQMSRQIPK